MQLNWNMLTIYCFHFTESRISTSVQFFTPSNSQERRERDISLHISERPFFSCSQFFISCVYFICKAVQGRGQIVSSTTWWVYVNVYPLQSTEYQHRFSHHSLHNLRGHSFRVLHRWSPCTPASRSFHSPSVRHMRSTCIWWVLWWRCAHCHCLYSRDCRLLSVSHCRCFNNFGVKRNANSRFRRKIMKGIVIDDMEGFSFQWAASLTQHWSRGRSRVSGCHS